MSDLISRQAALEELRMMLIALYGFDSTSVISCAIFKLQNLPSAQSEIVRCKDCRHANECHKSVQYTRDEPNTITIGYSPIEWCSKGKRRTDEWSDEY